MEKKIERLYLKIKDLKSEKDFLEEISKRREEYNFLFDDETIALLILDELGRNNDVFASISDLKPNGEYTVRGEVVEIGKPVVFTRRDGTVGRGINLVVSDSSGRCRLVLWDRDVELIERNVLKHGSKVKIVNGYVKNGFHGEPELSVGKWGVLLVENDEGVHKNTDVSASENVNVHEVTGELVEIQPTNAFFKNNGEYGFTKIKIKDNGVHRTLFLWDEKVREIQKFKKGDLLRFRNVEIRQKNQTDEIHVNKKSFIERV